MKLDPRVSRKIRETLVEAFPDPDLFALVVDDSDIDETFEQISMGVNGYAPKINKVIKHAHSQGHLTTLLSAAISQNEFHSDNLRSLAEAYVGPIESSAKSLSVDSRELERIVLEGVDYQDLPEFIKRLKQIKSAVCRIEPQPNHKDGYGTGAVSYTHLTLPTILRV